MAEFVEYVKSKPGALNYGSSGIGSTHHLTMESMKHALGLDITHVPYKGTGQSVPALVSGQVEMLFSAYPSLVGFVKDGRVKLIATNSAQRSSLAPNLPAISELIPGFDFAPIVGILAPAGTPPAIIQKVAAAAQEASKQPDAVAAFNAAGIDVVAAGPAGLRQGDRGGERALRQGDRARRGSRRNRRLVPVRLTAGARRDLLRTPVRCIIVVAALVPVPLPQSIPTPWQYSPFGCDWPPP